jgi:4-amino-4-deoxy-L-arabinose transferase-like glycosyltransferase
MDLNSQRQLNLDRAPSAWRWLTLLALAVVLAVLIYWIGGNRYPIVWDESEYYNAVLIDLNYFHLHGWGGLINSLLNLNNYRPPAHRLLMLPITLLLGADLSELRILSLLTLIAAAVFLYHAVAIVADRRTAYFAALMFGICSGNATACRLFATEPVTYLATTASIYFLFRAMIQPVPSHRTWLGLGFFMGLGVLAKLSFPWVVGPIFIGVVILRLLGRLTGLTLWQLLASLALATLIAAPWYLKNFQNRYLWLARQSQHWARMSSGELSPHVVKLWLGDMLSEGFGLPLAIMMLTAAVISTTILLASKIGRRSKPWIPFALCCAAMLPMPAAQLFFSTNHTIRIITPAFIPLYIAVALLAGASGILRWKLTFIATVVVTLWQLYTVTLPIGSSVWNGWDFHPLFQMAQAHRISAPRIAFLGSHPNFNRENVVTPFLEQRQFAVGTWLWQYLLPLDWNEIHQAADSSDMVLVAPDYKGTELSFERWDLDNAHNAQFDRWLRESGNFDGPLTFNPDRNHSVTMNVYFHKPGATQP